MKSRFSASQAADIRTNDDDPHTLTEHYIWIHLTVDTIHNHNLKEFKNSGLKIPDLAPTVNTKLVNTDDVSRNVGLIVGLPQPFINSNRHIKYF